MIGRTLADSPLALALSRGGWAIVVVALLSGAGQLLTPTHRDDALTFWSFAREHVRMYEPIAADYAARHADDLPGGKIDLTLIGMQPLQSRVVSGVQGGTPLADLIEIERAMAAQVLTGPLEGVGFVDLTDWIDERGLRERIVPASFELWTKQGRVFGLPHDVHPLLLVYRADIIEAAGIDVNRIQTWDDFVRLLKPLQDIDGDGDADRYLLAFDTARPELLEAMILQAGGAYFDPSGHPTLNNPINARVLATVAVWMSSGPGRITIEAQEFTASGNRLRADGRVLCALMPDWMNAILKADLPQLAGRLKIMPLPAWEPGGLRVSTWGGTMLGVPKSSEHIDQALDFAEELYTSRELAEELYRTNGIVTPVKEHWNGPWFDEPDPFFSNQPVGRVFLEYADQVPPRSNSVYTREAQTLARDALTRLRQTAENRKTTDPAELIAEAQRLLDAAQERITEGMQRNVFLQETLR